MSESKILLGFEVGSGTEVRMKLHHTVVTGMTQLSGKTTALEALISRSNLRAIAFKTKRGEAGFSSYRDIPPFFIEQSDWRYVSSLLEAILRERMKFERSWIIKATKGTKTLREVLHNVSELKGKARKDSLTESVYVTLEEYLLGIIPQIEKFNFSKELNLADGINVMDLSSMSLEMRSLVIRSVMEHVIDHLSNVIVIIPEAWEYIPQGRGTPVKLYAETFIRKGASIGNYLFVDSQDIAGIDKTPLRSCDNWIMGRQKETHEVDRFRDVIGKSISEEEIKGLPIGHFIAYLGNEIKKVYVLPAGVPEDVGRRVALGELTPEFVKDNYLLKKESDEELVWKEKYLQLEVECERQRESFETWKKMLEEDMEKRVQEASKKALETVEEIKKTMNVEEYRETIAKLKDKTSQLEAEYDKLSEEHRKFLEEHQTLTRLREALAPIIADISPSQPIGGGAPQGVKVILGLEHRELDVTVSHAEKQVNMTTDTVVGKILFCAINNLPKEGFSESELSSALQEFGWNIGHSTLAPTLANLAKDGYLVKLDTRPTKYRLPLKLKINVAK